LEILLVVVVAVIGMADLVEADVVVVEVALVVSDIGSRNVVAV
jgi:hypothetical protein